MSMMRATISRHPLVICLAVTVYYTALRMRKVLSLASGCGVSSEIAKRMTVGVRVDDF
jgi:hypothetical protein